MKTINYEQMEVVQGGISGKCLWSMGLTIFSWAALLAATGGAAAPFLIAGVGFIGTTYGTSLACDWR